MSASKSTGTPQDSALDADILDALNAAQAPSAEDDAAVERVRAKLIKRIAADSTPHHVAISADQGQWHRLLPGIERKVLHESAGVMSYLLRFAPGAVLPAHRHPVDEECVVLEGTICVGPLVLGAGGFHRVPAGVLDAETTTESGAVIYLRGATPKVEHLV